ncbi:glutamine amidotransferase [Caballeronia sp.]|uniref:glutamine amidotransferase n=1 Tax=Caballeronia sp. TaxID=1931223 RepID=UPI003C425270
MKREVLAIRHVYFEDLGSLELVLGDRGQLVRYLDVGRARIDAPDPLGTSLMVVLGGPIGAHDEALFPHLTPLLAMLEKRIAAGLPTIGICLGAQLIARALGARVYRAKQKELGWKALTLTDSGRASALRHFEADGRATPVLHWHGDTFDLPDGATRLAFTDACENQAFAWGDHVLGLQCHPEILVDRFESWLVAYSAEVGESPTDVLTLRAEASRHGPGLERAARVMFAEWLDRFD